jgi:hypothetical protein
MFLSAGRAAQPARPRATVDDRLLDSATVRNNHLAMNDQPSIPVMKLVTRIRHST